jgi:hypothetical protein
MCHITQELTLFLPKVTESLSATATSFGENSALSSMMPLMASTSALFFSSLAPLVSPILILSPWSSQISSPGGSR